MQVIEQESVKGFPEVVVGTNVSDCISHVIQVDVTSLPKNIFERRWRVAGFELGSP